MMRLDRVEETLFGPMAATPSKRRRKKTMR